MFFFYKKNVFFSRFFSFKLFFSFICFSNLKLTLYLLKMFNNNPCDLLRHSAFAEANDEGNSKNVNLLWQNIAVGSLRNSRKFIELKKLSKAVSPDRICAWNSTCMIVHSIHAILGSTHTICPLLFICVSVHGLCHLHSTL